VARDAALRLIERWHGRGRLSYAISPRFALTSSPEGLRAAAELKEACPAALVHTHLAENQAEIAEVRRLFPEASSYLDVYHRSGLTGPTAVFAHSIYLSSEDYRCLAATRSSIVHCPTSNLFLGSGLFNFAEARLHGIKVGLGTDVGGGTSFSLLKTMAEAYKVSTFHRHKLSALQAFYAATLGGAECLGMARYIGNFSSGKEADFIVINPRVSTLQKLRIKENLPLSEQLFALMILGDDRNIVATYCAGIQRY
jgi:guanine deaminase